MHDLGMSILHFHANGGTLRRRKRGRRFVHNRDCWIRVEEGAVIRLQDDTDDAASMPPVESHINATLPSLLQVRTPLVVCMAAVRLFYHIALRQLANW
jgi:hypothetical protein